MTFLDNLDSEYFSEPPEEEKVEVKPLKDLKDFINYLDTSAGYQESFLDSDSNLSLDLDSVNGLIDSLITVTTSAGADLTYRNLSRILNTFEAQSDKVIPKISMFNNFNSLLKSYNVFFDKMQHLRFNRYV